MPKPTQRQVRWLQHLASFDLEITHIPGRTNVVADILSRMHADQVERPIFQFPQSIKFSPDSQPSSTVSPLALFLAPAIAEVDDWTEAYREDPHTFAQYFDPDTQELKPEMRMRFKYG